MYGLKVRQTARRTDGTTYIFLQYMSNVLIMRNIHRSIIYDNLRVCVCVQAQARRGYLLSPAAVAAVPLESGFQNVSEIQGGEKERGSEAASGFGAAVLEDEAGSSQRTPFGCSL